MFLVGLTGGIATGKSTVANILKKFGVTVLDADLIARQVVEPGKPAWIKIKEVFGSSVLLEDGRLNRPELAQIIFSDSNKRKQLDMITHPQIYKELAWHVIRSFFKGNQFIVLDLPLLYESGAMVKYLHKVITVTCDESLQHQRLMERNQLSREEADSRICAQMSLDEKCKRADFIINNSGNVEDTQKQVYHIYNVLRCSYHHWKLRLLIIIGMVVVIYIVVWRFS